MRSQRGSSSIESIVSLALFLGMTASGGGLAYAGFTRLWCERVVRETAVCLQASMPLPICRGRAYQQLEAVLPQSWVGRRELQLILTPDTVRVDLKVRLSPPASASHFQTIHIHLTAR